MGLKLNTAGRWSSRCRTGHYGLILLEKSLDPGHSRDAGLSHIEIVYREYVACKPSDLLADVQFALPSLHVIWQRGAGSQCVLMA